MGMGAGFLVAAVLMFLLILAVSAMILRAACGGGRNRA